MRLFVAIRLTEPVRDALIRAQNDLYDHGLRGRYISEANLHLTLAFIGEWPDPQAVLEALSRVAFEPFEIALDGIGRFDDLWWAGLAPCPALEGLVRRVRRALADAGIPFDRKRFRAHITLIRLAEGPVPAIPGPRARMRVEAFSLMRSQQGRGGMIYTDLETVAARG